MTIPTPDEVTAWEIAYKARYKAEHTARNRAHAEAFTDGGEAMRVDHAAAYAEATVNPGRRCPDERGIQQQRVENG
jgi:hypothetical protein